MREYLLQLVGRHAGFGELFASLLAALALHQRLRLGEEVGQQQLRGRDVLNTSTDVTNSLSMITFIVALICNNKCNADVFIFDRNSVCFSSYS